MSRLSITENDTHLICIINTALSGKSFKQDFINIVTKVRCSVRLQGIPETVREIKTAKQPFHQEKPLYLRIESSTAFIIEERELCCSSPSAVLFLMFCK